VSTLRIPRTEFLKNLNIAQNERGAILTDEQGQTNIEGVWAAGDVRPVARQIAVAVGTGNYAALMIHRKLAETEI
jgi:thioredoxin reductase (NADPH)